MNYRTKDTLKRCGFIASGIFLVAIAMTISRGGARGAEPAKFTPPDPITITVSRQALQVIGNGLAELPLKTAAPILNDLQAQLNAADKAAEAATAPKAPEPAPPSAPQSSPSSAPAAEPAQK